nr:MAG TPA: hypothetical protein [Caudoviricetes sp.]
MFARAIFFVLLLETHILTFISQRTILDMK